jgi:hypothetical protein
MAFPISSPRIAANGTSSIPTRVTLFGSFLIKAIETSIPMKLVPIMTISLSLVTEETIFLVSSTVLKVKTPSRSAPSTGIFLGLPPGARTRLSYLIVSPEEVVTVLADLSTLVTDCSSVMPHCWEGRRRTVEGKVVGLKSFLFAWGKWRSGRRTSSCYQQNQVTTVRM